MKVLNYAKQCCDTIMRQYKAGELPPFPHFHYHAGVFLSGMERYYLLSGEEKYNDYIKEYLDTYVDSEGELHHVDKETLDDLQPCTLLYRYVNDEPRYRKVLDDYVPLLINWKVNPLGGFWHKGIHPNQMWLDSLYMAGPLGIKYGILTKQRKYIEIIHTQLELMWKHMRDEKTGLLYHAWDYGKKAVWADSVSGCSSQFWGRALGWYVVSSADMSEYLGDDPMAADFTSHARELIESLLKFQDERTGMWYQVVDKVEKEGNWLETSCSCLFLYGLCNLIRRGIIDKKYVVHADKAFNGIISEKTRLEGDDLIISDICIGTGVGDYEHYIKRPTTENDLHGTGAFLLMCTEYEKMKQSIE